MTVHGTIVAAIAAVLVLSGCATHRAADANDGAEMEDVNDPLEPVNRAFFRFNDVLDDYVFYDSARFYRDNVPPRFRNSVRNFLNNLDSPVIFANNLLQGRVEYAGLTAVRLGINSTLGFGGFADVASQMGIGRHPEDFGQTLGVYGFGEGPYLYLPLIGPAPPRDLIGLVAGYYMDPLNYVRWGEYNYLPYMRYGIDAFDVRSRNIDTLDDIERTSVDYYASIRSLYRQTRNNEIRNGTQDVQDLPEF